MNLFESFVAMIYIKLTAISGPTAVSQPPPKKGRQKLIRNNPTWFMKMRQTRSKLKLTQNINPYCNQIKTSNINNDVANITTTV